MIWVDNPKEMADRIRNGTFERLELVAVLDAPSVRGALPVIWITDQAGEKQFVLSQSHACVNRGAGVAGEAWLMGINRFGEFFLSKKVANSVQREIGQEKGYTCVGVTVQDGKYFANWVPTQKIILKKRERQK